MGSTSLLEDDQFWYHETELKKKKKQEILRDSLIKTYIHGKRRSKKDSNICISQAVPLSRNFSIEDNEWLTREVSEAEVWQAVKQIGPLKALRPDDDCIIFYKATTRVT